MVDGGQGLTGSDHNGCGFVSLCSLPCVLRLRAVAVLLRTVLVGLLGHPVAILGAFSFVPPREIVLRGRGGRTVEAASVASAAQPTLIVTCKPFPRTWQPQLPQVIGLEWCVESVVVSDHVRWWAGA